MKTLSIIALITFLAGCSSMQMSGTSGAGGAGYSADMHHTFDPDDPYHGG